MDTLVENLDLFVTGFSNTGILFTVSAGLALLLGTITAALRICPLPSLRGIGAVYVTTVRNTPLTLIFLFFVFGYPKLGFPHPGYILLAICALTVYTATYVCEVVRSGVLAVPASQTEAARAMGLRFGQVLRLIILPQAFRYVIPPLMSVFIALLKNTTVAAGFSVMEAGAIRANLSERGYPALTGLLWVALGFVGLVAILSVAQRRLEFSLALGGRA